MVDSWVGNGPNQPIEAGQLEHVLGASEIDTIASQAGVERGVAASALAALLPDAFNTLTEDGRVPTSIPDRIRGFMDDLGDFFRGIGAGAMGLGAAAVGGVAGAADRVDDAVREPTYTTTTTTARPAEHAEVTRDAGGGIGKLLPWLLLAGLVIAAIFFFRGCSKQETAPAPAPGTTTPAATTPVATTSRGFTFANEAGKVTVAGALASEAEKTRLVDALKATFGVDNIRDDISIDTTAAPAGWMDKLIAMLPDLKAEGLKFGFDGDKLTLDTSGLSEAERFAISQKFRNAFSGFEISGLWDQAMAALANLKDGFTGSDLVKALDLSNIYFDTGKATITRDSLETLTKAAEYIKKAPAGTRIEVSGHTDSDGDDAANMTLSQQRADAVVSKLQELGVAAGTLAGKGYGETQPVGDNATDAGKALNRRIDFSVAQ